MTATRTAHSAAVEARVALAAVSGDQTVNELAAQFGARPTPIHGRKTRLLAGAEQAFAGGAKAAAPGDDEAPEPCERTGRLEVELDRVGNNAAPPG